jgi:GNAT superfamily N-acetyltransferase
MRTASDEDLDLVTTTVALAFATDPVWGPALATESGSTHHLAEFWRPFVQCAVQFSTVFLSDDRAAVAVWIPPGERELTEVAEVQVEALIERELSPSSVAAMAELWSRLDKAHPSEPEHAYLSLLATHPAHRGRGVGQALLRETLELVDEWGVPAYLESSNPVNIHRYARAGFAPIGSFTTVLDPAVVTTMWRESVGSISMEA